jgi:hypothetical protein
VGTGLAFSVDAVSFIVAAGLIALLSSGAVAATRRSVPGVDAPTTAGAPEASPAAEAHESFGAALRGGLRYVAGDPAIRSLMLLSLLLNLALSGPGAVGMAWLAENRFDAGPVGLGLMAAGFAGGAFVGTVLAGNSSLDRQGRIVIAAVIVAGLAVIVVGILPWLPGAVAGLFALGLSIGYTNIVGVSWLQARVEPALVGRVMSLVMLMGFGITPLSLGLAGALIDVNAVALFVGAGLLVVAAGILGLVIGFPAMLDGQAGMPRPGPEVVPDSPPGR